MLKIGTILLTKNDQYLTDSGHLPQRPSGDKAFLRTVCLNGKVSRQGYELLPPSVRKVVTVDEDYTVPVTIRELAESDILLVNRSPKCFEAGCKFRLGNFRRLGIANNIEVWVNTREELNHIERLEDLV